MTNLLESIISRILRDPDDEAARLDAAVLFDASDPPRAQHIRLGIEIDRELLAHFTAHPDGRDPPRLETWAQVAAIAQAHGSRWCEPLAHLYDPGVPQPAWHVDRGFIGSARVRADDLAEQADALTRHPIESLQVARPRTGTVRLADILAQPIARRVTSLFLNDLPLTSADYEALASCETLDRCELISLPFSPIYNSDLERLASSQRLRDLMLAVHAEVRPDPGSDRYWQSARAASLEAQHGHIPWFHPTFPADRDLAGVAPRLRRRLRAAGVVAPVIAPLGTFQPLSYGGLSDAGFGAVTRILDARGYGQGSNERLRYGFTKDGAAGWSGWTYWLDVTEYSDAPVAEEIERALAQGW
jgi:hypothetical protein